MNVLAKEYERLRDSGVPDKDAIEIVDAMLTVGEYVEAKRGRYERRVRAEKHDTRGRIEGGRDGRS